jgi:hypothetical protein
MVVTYLNNILSENSIRPLGKMAQLFSHTTADTDASAIYQSLIDVTKYDDEPNSHLNALLKVIDFSSNRIFVLKIVDGRLLSFIKIKKPS